MKKNVLIVGAGAVAHVVAHKCAQNNDILGNICIASRKKEKCDKIIESIRRKRNLKDKAKKLYSRQVDATDVPSLVKLIKSTKSSMVINLGTAYINMSVLEGCIRAGVDYIDTAIHEDPTKVCEDPPWYGNYEWKRKAAARKKASTPFWAPGFDPGVVNAYTAWAVKHEFDSIDTIDIMDVNAGRHGRYFATNFDPEINFREFKKVWAYIDRKWVEKPVHAEKVTYDFPVVGRQTVYLTGHDELHSLYKNVDANSIRFWMGFGDHYINVFNVLKNVGYAFGNPGQNGGRNRSDSLKSAESRPARSHFARQELHGVHLHREPDQGQAKRTGQGNFHLQRDRSRRLLQGR